LAIWLQKNQPRRFAGSELEESLLETSAIQIGGARTATYRGSNPVGAPISKSTITGCAIVSFPSRLIDGIFGFSAACQHNYENGYIE